MGARLTSAFALILGFMAAGPARADQLEEAREAFRAGAGAAKNADWTDALRHFQRSSALRPHAATTYNLGYCELQLGHATRARKFLRRALSEDEVRPGELGQLKSSAEQHLATADAAVARLELLSPPGTMILVDGRPLEFEAGGPPPIMLAGTREAGAAELLPAGAVEVILDRGLHRIVTRTDQATQAETRDLTFESGKTITLDLHVGDMATGPLVEPESEGLGPQKTGALVLGSLGATSLVFGGIIAGVAASEWSDAQDACDDPQFCPNSLGPDLAGNARIEANMATAAFVIGGAALAGGIVLWVSAPNPFGSSDEPATVGFNGQTVTMRTRW